MVYCLNQMRIKAFQEPHSFFFTIRKRKYEAKKKEKQQNKKRTKTWPKGIDALHNTFKQLLAFEKMKKSPDVYSNLQ